jgi:anti-sigma B factor antagonist
MMVPERMDEPDPLTSPFSGHVHVGEGLVVVTLHGEADLSSLDALDAAFDEAVALDGPIVTDLTPLEFLDSSALRMLIQAHTRVTGQGRRFALAAPPESAVGQVLEMTQVQRIMPVYGDRETAVRATRS